MLTTIVIILLVLMLVGALPQAGYAQNYRLSGGLGLVVLILLILLLMGKL